MTDETRLIDMTIGELLDILDRRYGGQRENASQARAYPKTVFGLDGIAELYGCSKSTAARMKSSGILDDSITQIGRKIIVNVDKALSIKPNTNNN